MKEISLEAPCGIHCGLCPLHQAIADEALRTRLAEMLKMPVEKVGCTGCRSIEGHCRVIGEQCATWLCSRDKGVEFCSDCAEFPCVKLMPCADRASVLPHNIKVYSLSLRKAKGADAWRKEIEEVYDLYYQGKMAVGRGPKHKG